MKKGELIAIFQSLYDCKVRAGSAPSPPAPLFSHITALLRHYENIHTHMGMLNITCIVIDDQVGINSNWQLN